MSGRRILLCEGPEDVAAFRELLTRRLGYKRGAGTKAWKERSVELVLRDRAVSLKAVPGARTQLANEVTNLITAATLDSPIERIGMSFDPDGDDDPTWTALLFDPIAPGWDRVWADGLLRVTSPLTGLVTEVAPLPWSFDVGGFDELELQQNLERGLIAALSRVFPERVEPLESWLTTIRERGWKPNPCWKTAVKLWHAVVYPKEELVEKVTGQDARVRDVFFEIIEPTPLWKGLCWLAE